MSPIAHDSIFFDEHQTRDRALEQWTIADIESRQGLGMRLWRGDTPPILGRNGAWRIKGALGAIVGLSVLEVVLAGAGCALPLWTLIVAGPHVSAAARSLDGATSPWRRARAEGKGLFRAFAAMCSAQAKIFAANAAINTSTPLVIAAGVAELSLSIASQALAPRGKGPLAAPLAAAVKRSADFGLSIYQGPWAAGEARKAARFDQALKLSAPDDLALAAYRRLATAHLRHTLLLDSFSTRLPPDQALEILGPVRWKVRHALKPMLSSAPCEPADLEAILDFVDATQTDPWWSPTAHTPPLAELAKKIRMWQIIKSAASDPSHLDQRVSGLLASYEAHLLVSAVLPLGEAAPSPRLRGTRL
jgi:hypothetical protein